MTIKNEISLKRLEDLEKKIIEIKLLINQYFSESVPSTVEDTQHDVQSEKLTKVTDDTVTDDTVTNDWLDLTWDD
jgi:hypothetical protein